MFLFLTTVFDSEIKLCIIHTHRTSKNNKRISTVANKTLLNTSATRSATHLRCHGNHVRGDDSYPAGCRQ